MADNQPGKPSARWRKFVNDRPIASLILTGAIATQLGTYFGYVFPAVGLPTLPWPMYNGALAQGIKGPVWGDYFAADYSITGHGATGLFFTGMALHFVNGIVFAILFGVLAAGLAAMMLAVDFDLIEKGVQRGWPKGMEWYAAFGLLTTLVWLYLELLRLLSKLQGNRR